MSFQRNITSGPINRGHAEEFKSPSEVQYELNSRSDDKIGPKSVLLFTVLNANYPINVEIIYKVCNKVIANVGKVLRIVIFGRGVVQAMVEFDKVKTAATARENLHGADIYSGSCTLKVEYARTETLQIKKNNELSWDFTEGFKSQGGLMDGPRKARPGLLDDEIPQMEGNSLGGMMNGKMGGPNIGMGGGMEGMGNRGGMGSMGGMGGMVGGVGGMGSMNMARGMGNMGGGMGGMGMGRNMGMYQQYDDMMGRNMSNRNDHGGLREGSSSIWPGQSGGRQMQPGSCVVMIYGMEPDKLNCQRLFNLFCQYGNINRIMFLKNKEGCAMLEMGDVESVERAIRHLNNVKLFGSSLKLDVSRSVKTIEDVRVRFDLPDDTPSCKDFWGDRNNRFSNFERAAKNRIIAPTKCLHFYNIPKMEDEELESIFSDLDAPFPNKIKWLPSKSEKSCLGLLEFRSVEEASEALVIVNHTEIDSTYGVQKYPYEIKLCFSPATF